MHVCWACVSCVGVFGVLGELGLITHAVCVRFLTSQLFQVTGTWVWLGGTLGLPFPDQSGLLLLSHYTCLLGCRRVFTSACCLFQGILECSSARICKASSLLLASA